MSLSAAAVALGVASSVVAAAPPGHNPKKSDPPSSTKKAPKLSKWQQHVLESLKNSAPGDEYFGRMKMSYLGINNTFHDDAIRAGSYTTDPRLVSAVSFADEALNAWAKKYPNDPQLARSYFLAFQLYRKVWTPDGQQKAWNYAHIVVRKWPSSFFGKALKKDLGIGYTEHYFATPVPCASLIASASPGASSRPGPTPSASPTPSPTPTPTPTAAPGQPKIDILPVPCSTPTPSPTPLPTLSPIPTGSLSPSPLPSSSASPSSKSSAPPSATPSPSASASPSPTPTASPTHRP